MDIQQNVVFFIGAGFSAPFGLPVMSNFIDKAKDLYFSDEEKYSSLKQTLKLIDTYSKVKNYMNIDLHNIEDLLSTAYTGMMIGSRKMQVSVIEDFIRIVIEAYTDDGREGVMTFSQYISNTRARRTQASYRQGNNKIPRWDPIPCNDELLSCGVISLNYDMLIEKALKYISEDYGRYYRVSNKENPFDEYLRTTNVAGTTGIPMCKLHGSVDKRIVPPTWNKSVEEDVIRDWKLAGKLLRDATHIVFLGYSLPSTDNYVRFLLANSLNENMKLKRISVVTIDSDGSTENRYRSQFSSRFQFHNANILHFLKFVTKTEMNIDFDYFDTNFRQFLSSL